MIFLAIIFMMSRVKKYWPHILFIVFLILLNLVTYKDYGIAWDEKYYFDLGKYYLYHLFKTLKIGNNLSIGSFQPVLSHIQTHGVLFDVLAAALTLPFKTFTFEKYHLIKAMLTAPIFILVAWMVNKLLGRKASLIAMILLLVFPRFYGEVFHNSIDMATTLSLTLLLGYFIYYLKSRQSFWQQVLLGLVSAISINQRLILGYLFILNLIFILIVDWHRKKPISYLVLKPITILFATILFMHLTRPYLLTHPIVGLYDMFLASTKYPYFASVLFDGRSIMTNQLPWYYLPKIILITAPLATIFLFIVGFGRLIHLIGKEKKNFSLKMIYLYLILLFTIPIGLVFVLKPTLYDGWRQMLFLTVPIIIIASFGYEALRTIKIKFGRLLLLFSVALGLSLTVWQMIKLYPYQYIYFNELVGGLPGAYGRYDTDYSGAAFKEAMGWFNKNIYKEGETYKILTMGDPFGIAYYFKKNTYLTSNPVAGDYFFSYTRWFFHEMYQGEVIHMVKRQGVPLIFVKRL